MNLQPTLFDSERRTMRDALDLTRQSLLAYGEHYDHWAVAFEAPAEGFPTGIIADVYGGDEPVHVISAGGQHHGIVAATVIRHFGESVGQEAGAPAPTTVAGGGGKTGLVAAYLAQHNGGFNENPGHPATDPVSAIICKGSQQQLVAASAVAYYGSEQDGQSMDEAARTASRSTRRASCAGSAAARPSASSCSSAPGMPVRPPNSDAAANRCLTASWPRTPTLLPTHPRSMNFSSFDPASASNADTLAAQSALKLRGFYAFEEDGDFGPVRAVPWRPGKPLRMIPPTIRASP